eukprot:scaffold486_cov79-Cylindrotheca_fusiformis.AAC.2
MIVESNSLSDMGRKPGCFEFGFHNGTKKENDQRAQESGEHIISQTTHVVTTSSVQHIAAGENEMDGSDMKDRLKHRKDKHMARDDEPALNLRWSLRKVLGRKSG